MSMKPKVWSKLITIATLSIAVNFGGAAVPVFAGEVDVIEVTIANTGGDNFRINATLKHEDTGWDHYANKWEVLDENGNLLGTRELAHPHVNEQPFTRSLTVKIPVGIKRVTIRAYDSVHEDGGLEKSVDVPER